MTNKEQPITKILSITLLFAILFTGALSISPTAFSTGYDDDDHDDCDDDHHSKYDDDDDSVIIQMTMMMTVNQIHVIVKSQMNS